MAFKNIFNSFIKKKKEIKEDTEISFTEDTRPSKKLHRSESDFIQLLHYKSVEDTIKILWVKSGDIRSSFLGQILCKKEYRPMAIRSLVIIEHSFGMYHSNFWETNIFEPHRDGGLKEKLSIFNINIGGGGKPQQPAVPAETKEAKRSALGIILTSLVDPPPRVIKTSLPEKYTLKDLFEIMLKEGASDLHISIGLCPKFRIKGELADLSLPPVSENKSWELISGILSEKQIEIFNKEFDLDFTYEVSELARFRSNILKENSGVGAVFRIIPPEIPSMEELGLPSVLKKIATYNQGLIIVAGPTGSGKTTTMACLIDYINSTRSANILTIEEPLEFIHKNKMSRINYREVGIHTPDFATAVAAARREDLDVIMIGDMMGEETLLEAIQAADMGNLVIGIMYTTGVTRTIDRIIETFPGQKQGQMRSMLSSSLRATIAQQLIPTMDGAGRCAVVEIALANPSLSNMIRDGKTKMINSVVHSSRDIGMQSLDLALLQLVKAGKISEETARLRSSSPSSFTVSEEFKFRE